MGVSSHQPQHPDLWSRVLVNGISAILIAVFIFVGIFEPLKWLFVAAIAAIAATALWEYDQLLKKKEFYPAVALGIVSTILYVFAIFFKTQDFSFWGAFWYNLPVIVLGLALFGCFVYCAVQRKSPLVNVSTTFFGIVYIAIPLGLFVSVMYFFNIDGTEDIHYQGVWWIIYLLLVTKGGDMGAYFVGRYFGRRKLALSLSPNKTLEGAAGAFLISMCISLFLCILGKNSVGVYEKFTYIQSLWLGGIIGIFGQIGDLAESFFKRDAHVKDSNAIPGVGGILDMVDSLIFTAPIVYTFLRILYT